MRIHGDKVITRSREIKAKSDYHAYLPELQEDFKHIHNNRYGITENPRVFIW